MSFAKENLSKGEKIVYHTQQHWVLFIESVSIILTGLLILYLSYTYAGEATQYVNYLSYGTLLFGLGKFVIEYIHHHSSEFVITTERVIIKVGVFKSTSLAIPLSKIESVEVNQSFFGQLLDFGSIHITGTGTATSKFEFMNHPGMFRKKIQLASEMEESAHNGGTKTEEETESTPKSTRRLRRR
jgi:uncharacterized membrane protein YdbT with pleckstrin-like domain